MNADEKKMPEKQNFKPTSQPGEQKDIDSQRNPEEQVVPEKRDARDGSSSPDDTKDDSSRSY